MYYQRVSRVNSIKIAMFTCIVRKQAIGVVEVLFHGLVANHGLLTRINATCQGWSSGKSCFLWSEFPKELKRETRRSEKLWKSVVLRKTRVRWTRKETGKNASGFWIPQEEQIKEGIATGWNSFPVLEFVNRKHLLLFLTRHRSHDQKKNVRETNGGEWGGQSCQHDHQLLHCQGKYV